MVSLAMDPVATMAGWVKPVVTADHGEVLSEERDGYAHGSTVGDGVMRVPLVVWGRGVRVARGAVVSRHVDMAALAPTLEEGLGLEPTLGDRAPFWDMVRPGPVWDEDGWITRRQGP